MGMDCLSFFSVVCCQVKVSASGRSLAQRSATECETSKCFRETSTLRWARSEYSCLATEIQGESLARGTRLLSMYTVEQRGFLFRKYWQTGSFKACQTAFRTEFAERRAPSKCSFQKLVKKLETRGSRSNACRLLSLGSIEGQSVKKCTPHNRTTQRRYTPRDSSLKLRHFGKCIWGNAFKCAWM